MPQVVPGDRLSMVRDQHFGAGDGEAFSRSENEGTNEGTRKLRPTYLHSLSEPSMRLEFVVSPYASASVWAHNPKVGGSNPPPATNLFNQLHQDGQFARERIFVPLFPHPFWVTESLFLMLLSCFPAAVDRPPACCAAFCFLVSRTVTVHCCSNNPNGASASAAPQSACTSHRAVSDVCDGS